MTSLAASEADVTSLAASQADVTRLRLGLEGTWRGLATQGGGSFVPSLEVGVRHDGGDAETGFGVDIGAGLAWRDSSLGIEGAPHGDLEFRLEASRLDTADDDAEHRVGFTVTARW